MKKKIFGAIVAGALVCVGAFGLFGCGGSSEGDGPLTFTTGSETGTYYGFGTVLATYANENFGTDITAVVGAGSKGNIQDLQDGNADIAFVQSDVLSYAYNNDEKFGAEGYDGFSIVAPIYQEQVQILTRDDSIQSVADLAGKHVAIGEAGSGVYYNACDILNAYGIDPETGITPELASFSDSEALLENGQIDAAFIVAGYPTAAVTTLFTNKPDTHLVAIDDAHANQLANSNDFYVVTCIPAGTYTGQDEDVTTVAIQAVIIANDTVSEDAVYNLLASIYDGAVNNAEAHPKYAEFNLEDASAFTNVPYHAGAAKFFAEHDITVATK